MKNKNRVFVFFLVLSLLVPSLTGISKLNTVSAAVAGLNVSSKRIIMGTTYQFSLKNVDTTKVDSAVWKVNRKSVATVDQAGLVTPVAYGTTTVKCIVTYTSGAKATLSAKIYVRDRIASESVKITNLSLNSEGYQEMYVGSKLTLSKEVKPSDTNDTAYFSSLDTAVASVSSKGVITAKKAGITLIQVRMGADENNASQSNAVNTYFFLKVDDRPAATSTPTPVPTSAPQVSAVTLSGSNELTISFNQPVLRSSVVSGTKLISDSIVVGSSDGANAIGTLTPALSSDRKTLTLTSTGTFNGVYSVVVSGNVKNDSGNSFAQYSTICTLKDTTGPVYTGPSTDETGWKAYINFNEAISIKGLSVSAVSGTTDAVLTTYLKNVENYTLSADKKSIIVDLTGLTTLTNLTAVVKLKGITDIAGNATSSLIQTVNVITDTGTKPLAELVSAQRISKTTVKAEFSSAISYGGYMKINSALAYGTVDSSDHKVVTYTIPEASQGLTGSQVVTFNSWMSYNALTARSTDDSRVVDFTLDTVIPVLTASSIENVTVNGISYAALKLTYSKNIATASTSQQISVRITSNEGDVATITPTSTTADVDGNVVTYYFSDAQMLLSGKFSITLPAGVVSDSLSNSSAATTVILTKAGASGSALPAPSSVTQSSTDNNVIYVTFSNKLDIDTAEDEASYVLAGSYKVPDSAVLTKNDDTGAVVALTFASGTFTSDTTSYELIIQFVKGYNNSYTAIDDCHIIFTAVENTKPYVTSLKLSGANVILTFSEGVKGTCKVNVTDAATQVTYTGTGYASDTNVYVTLSGTVTSSTAKVVFTDNSLYDTNNNQSSVIPNQVYIASK